MDKHLPHCVFQAFCSAACHWFGVVACKIHAVRMSFALPLCSTGPAVLGLGLILFMTEATKLDTGSSDSITGEVLHSGSKTVATKHLTISQNNKIIEI